MKNTDLKEFYFRIKNEIEDTDDQPSSTLTKIYTDILYDNGTISDFELLYFEKDATKFSEIKINGFSLNIDEERLDLFITHYNPSEKVEELKFSKVLELLGSAKNFYTKSVKKLYEKINKKEDAYDISKDIFQNSKKISTVRTFVFTNCSCLKLPKNRNEGKIEFQNYLYDLNQIYKASLGGADSTDIKIDFKKFKNQKVRCMLAHKTKDKISSYMAIFPGEVMYNIYRLFGQKLMNLNVRSFLQLKTKINKGIQETLLEEPSRFFSYNNGIAVVVDEIQTEQDKDGSYLTFASGFQIVNGGQTTATLFRTKKQNSANFTDVMIPAKITLVKKEDINEIVPKISHSANTQNVVKKADFSSNHDFHHSIKKLSNKVTTSNGKKWFYERMRGEYQVQKTKEKDLGKNKKSKLLELSPPNMKFTKEDLAKYINCWHYLDPHIACTGAQKNFIVFMKSLNDKKFIEKVDEEFFQKYCSISILFTSTAKIIKENNSIAGYRSQVVNYTISLISSYTNRKLNFNSIWADQELSSDFKELINKWSTKIYETIQKTAKGKNVSEWCKKEDCWNEITDRNFTFSETPIEFTNIKVEGKPVKTARDILSPEDMDNIKKVKSVSSKDLEKIIYWAQDTDEFYYNQIAILSTLWSQSLRNWIKPPTAKQAASALKVINKAEEADII